MTTPIKHGSKEYWQALADVASSQEAKRIRAGIRVQVDGGRKHKGRTGTVTRHQQTKFGYPFRYGGDANIALRQMMGREGYVALVTPDDGKDTTPFWVACQHLTPLPLKPGSCPDCGAALTPSGACSVPCGK